MMVKRMSLKPPFLYRIVMIAAVLIVSVGGAMAADPVPQTVGTTGITSDTSVSTIGTVTLTQSLTWIQSGTPSHDPPLVNGGWPLIWIDANGNFIPVWSVDPWVIFWWGPAPDGEIRYTAGYTAQTSAVQGATTLTTSMNVDSANQIADKNNIQATTLMTFAALDEAGQAVGSEDILVDGVGSQRITDEKSFNPFASLSGPFTPPFANTVNSGSSFNILLGTVNTAASGRFVAADSDVPVAQAYSITGRGITSSAGTTPAVGTMSAFMNANLQEGTEERIFLIPPAEIPAYLPGLAAEISYAQLVSASGTINAFGQSYQYTGI